TVVKLVLTVRGDGGEGGRGHGRGLIRPTGGPRSRGEERHRISWATGWSRVSPPVASGHTKRSHVIPHASIWPAARAPERSAPRRDGAFCGRMAETTYDSPRTSRA